MVTYLDKGRTEAKLKEIPVKEGKAARILVIDDDVELLEELKESLLNYEYDVEVVPNSTLAYEVACELMPDLILMDLKMKPKSGFQLADELHNSFKTKDIPIIAITGFFTEKEHMLMMKMFGIKHAMLKPVNPPELVAKIEAVLKEAQGNTETSS